jgi:hypothetical protein
MGHMDIPKIGHVATFGILLTADALGGVFIYDRADGTPIDPCGYPWTACDIVLSGKSKVETSMLKSLSLSELIVGKTGKGKTSRAVRLAHWAMALLLAVMAACAPADPTPAQSPAQGRPRRRQAHLDFRADRHP